MVKKCITALSFLLPVAAVGFFHTGDMAANSCIVPGDSSTQAVAQNQSTKSDRVYQIWCGGVY